MMTKQNNFQKDLTKKDLIKILEKIDSERTRQTLKDYSFMEEDSGEKKIRSESVQFQNTAGTLIGGKFSGLIKCVQAL